PRIADYLHVEGHERGALLVELVHVDLEFRLKSGESARVEGYLAAHPELAGARDVALDLIAAEYELRHRHQGGAAVDEYRDRFPDYFNELRDRLSAPPGEVITAPGEPAAWPTVPGYEIVGEIGRGGMGV